MAMPLRLLFPLLIGLIAGCDAGPPAAPPDPQVRSVQDRYRTELDKARGVEDTLQADADRQRRQIEAQEGGQARSTP